VLSEATVRREPSERDMRRKRPPALSFLLRADTARRVARVVSLLALDFAGVSLAIFTALATTRTNHLLGDGASQAHALTSGFQRALLAGSIFILASAFIGLRATNTRGEAAPAAQVAEVPA